MQLGPVKRTARGFQIIEFVDHYRIGLISHR
jgi:hypothetical protein